MNSPHCGRTLSFKRVGVKGMSKKEKGLMDMDKSMVIVGGRVGSLEGLNGNGENTIKKTREK